MKLVDTSHIENATSKLLRSIGENVDREGLLDTPARVAKAWTEWAAGYAQDPKEILRTFKDGGESYNNLVLVRDIQFYSHCEHHLAPFFGRAHIGYIPNGRIVGLSKLPRVVDCFARRLQVQERLTDQVADAISEALHPKGVGVVIEARHLCMESRGICKPGSITVTSALRGVLMDEPDTRAEFLSLCRSQPNVSV